MRERTYDVFVSYRSVDKVFASKLAEGLKDAGLRVWLDAWKMLGGDSFMEKIEEGLRRSRSVAVLVGREGVGPWQAREIARATEGRRRRLIPVLLPRARLDSRTPLALSGLSLIDLRRGLSEDGLSFLAMSIKGKAETISAGKRPRRQPRRQHGARAEPAK